MSGFSYFVSYAWTDGGQHGFGWAEIERPERITTGKHIEAVADALAKRGASRLIVLHFQLLSEPDIREHM